MIKFRIFFLTLCFIGSIAAAPAQSSHKTYAIVVGISKYQNVPSLGCADKDAISFYNYLLSPAGDIMDSNDIKLFTNENATSYNIVSAMEYLMRTVKENDKVYFYFAGHGDVEHSTAYKMGYLLCSTSPSTCYPAGGSLDMNYLESFAKTLVDKKDSVILILDACRAGKLLAGGEEGKLAFSVAVNEWKGITKILSCQPGESSYEYNNLGNGGAGIFTYYLIRGLEGLADYNNDSRVTIEELGEFLRDSVKKFTINERKPQRPVVCCDIDATISKVDKNILTDLIVGNKEISNRYLSSHEKGFQPVLSEIKTEDILNEYDRFNTYIKANKLIRYDSTENKEENALFIYHRLKNNKKAKALAESMKNTLIATLMNNSQVVTNIWLEGNQSPYSLLSKTQKELSAVFELTDSNSISFKHVKATYLFFTYNQKGTYADLEKTIRQCIDLEPNNPCFYHDLGYIQLQNGLYDSALSNFDIALKFAPNWSWAWCNKGHVLSSLGKDDGALKCYDKAIELKPDLVEAWMNKGIDLFTLGKYEEAIKCEDRAIKLKPDLVEAWMNKGISLAYLNKKEEAIKCSDKATELKPNDALAWYGKACMYSVMKNKEKMLESLKKAIELGEDSIKSWAKTDPDLKNFWDDPDFKKLVK